MDDFSAMTLKILYSLDDGSNGSYLARSKKPQRVRVANIPNPCENGSDSKTLRIGAVNLSAVLNEIYLNSPEVLANYTYSHGYDYNVYFKDVCETDEPLVSLGILSKIRTKLGKQSNNGFFIEEYDEEEEEEEEEDDDDDDDESLIVTGRVCSNFAALLRRSYSTTSSKKKNSVSDNVTTPETLEVKLRFTKIIASKQNMGITTSQSVGEQKSITEPLQIQQHAQHSKTMNKYPQPQIKQYVTPKMRAGKITKRQTNPMPAPKAVRTQSLPIWNIRQNTNGPGAGTLRNSIAHKIYLADRQTDLHSSTNATSNTGNTTQQLAYEINTLQQDNTVHKVKIDDSVSKRFDFMNKKKVTTETKPKKTAKKHRAKTVKHSSTKTPNNGSSENISYNDQLQNAQNPTPSDDMEIDKENIPPMRNMATMKSAEPTPIDTTATDNSGTVTTHNNNSNAIKELELNLLNFNENDINWLQEFPNNGSDFNFDPTNPSSDGMMPPSALLQNATTQAKNSNKNSATSVVTAPANNRLTPRDAQTLIDMDRTSPIDTLSMPLMDLDPSNGHRSNVPSCQEQLRRLPLLAPTKKNQRNSVDINSEETMLVNYSTPDKRNNEDEEEEEEEEGKKNQRIMPSSPSMMFGYREDDDIFSSFVNHDTNGSNEDAENTPATTIHFTSDEK